MIRLYKDRLPKHLISGFIILFGIIAGIKFYLLGYAHQSKHFIEAFYFNPVETFDNFLQSDSPKDTIHFFISNKNQLQLSRDREKRIGKILDFLSNKRKRAIINDNKEEVNGNMYYKKKKMRVEIKIPGLMWDHFLNPQKTSLRIKIKDSNNFKGTKQFNLLRPKTRGYLLGYVINKIAKNFNVISIDYSPVHIIINGQHMGIYLFEDFFNKYLIEKNHKKDSLIFTINNRKLDTQSNNNKIKIYHPNLNKLNQYQKTLINNIEDNLESFNKIIDEDKFITLFAIGFLTNSWHQFYSSNLFYYYNPHTNLLEPIIREVNPRELINNDFSGGVEILKILKPLTLDNPLLYNFLNKKSTDLQFMKKLEYKIISIIDDYKNIILSNEFFKYDLIFNKESIVNSWSLNILDKNINIIKKTSFFNYIKNSMNQISNSLDQIDTIRFQENLIIDKTIIVNPSQVLIINEGSKLKFKNNANIIVYGNIQIDGSKTYPVSITNIDNSSSSIIGINTTATNNISYTNFHNLSNFDKDLWINSSSLTFYESIIEIKHSSFNNNKSGDDYLNIVRSSYFINECKFNNIINDAIDIDFSNGTIKNCIFNKIGNDAIDFSGSYSQVSNCKFINCIDKAISCGELSNILIRDCKISFSYFGIVSKDLSLVNTANTFFSNNNFDFGIYKKKDEYGVGRLIENNNFGILKILVDEYATYNNNNNKKKVKIVKINDLEISNLDIIF